MEKVKKVLVVYSDDREEWIEGKGSISRHSTTVDVEDPVTRKIETHPVKFITIGMPCAEH